MLVEDDEMSKVSTWRSSALQFRWVYAIEPELGQGFRQRPSESGSKRDRRKIGKLVGAVRGVDNARSQRFHA